MSKTKGNVVDPIEIVKQYGTDAVRFTLASMASPGADIAFNVARTEGYRAFANKIWNAARFIFMNVDRAAEIGITVDPAALGQMPGVAADAPLEARWIVAELHATVSSRSISLLKTTATTTRPISFINSSGAASAIGTSKSSSCASISPKPRTRRKQNPHSPRWFRFLSALCACCRPSCPS